MWVHLKPIVVSGEGAYGVVCMWGWGYANVGEVGAWYIIRQSNQEGIKSNY